MEAGIKKKGIYFGFTSDRINRLPLKEKRAFGD